MNIDQYQWFKDNVKGKVKPCRERTEIVNGRSIISISGIEYNGQRYDTFDQVVDIIKQKYMDDYK